MLQIPQVRPGKWRLRDAFLDLVGCGCAFGAGALGAINSYASKGSEILFYGSLVFAAIALVAGSIRFRRSLAKENRYEPLQEPREIAGWARGCYDLLDSKHGLSKNVVRFTVYRVVTDRRMESPDTLEQLISYVGGEGGPPGRIMSARAGVIGVAARSGQPISASRRADDLGAFRREMVRFWGYTSEETRAASPDRWSFFACPILEMEDGPAVAVVYFDSGTRLFFEDHTVQESIIQQAGVLARILFTCYAQ